MLVARKIGGVMEEYDDLTIGKTSEQLNSSTCMNA